MKGAAAAACTTLALLALSTSATGQNLLEDDSLPEFLQGGVSADFFRNRPKRLTPSEMDEWANAVETPWDDTFIKELTTNCPTCRDIFGDDLPHIAAAIQAHPGFARKGPRTLNEGLTGANGRQTFDQRLKSIQQIMPHPEDELEYWLMRFAAKSDNEEAKSILERLAMGDLSFYDAAQNTATAVGKATTNDELTNKNAVMQNQMGEEALRKGYRELVNNQAKLAEEGYDLTAFTARWLRSEDDFVKTMQAGANVIANINTNFVEASKSEL